MPDLKQLPSVHKLLNSKELLTYTNYIKKKAAQIAIDHYRELAKNGQEFTVDEILEFTQKKAEELSQNSQKPVINMSGVILHTGLGRARLSDAANEQIFKIAQSYSNLEYNLATGMRGDRQSHVKDLLKELTGAEDALIVNNCAGAVFLTLSALCKNREVLLSHGQMVEIGGSFRMPEIVKQAGCQLVGVGCTNKTKASDYINAITENTGAILRCHPSNFKILGFTDKPSDREISEISNKNQILFIDDMGSGCLIDTTQYNLPKEKTLSDAINDGADIVMASGDKLLGGPQAGIIIGKNHLIEKIKKHPLARALRIDKLSLAALEATLKLYQESRHDEIPLWNAIQKPLNIIKNEAKKITKISPYPASIEKAHTEIGSGSLPTICVETYVAVLNSPSSMKLAGYLRSLHTPVITRIRDNQLLLDPRTINKTELNTVINIIKNLPTI